MNMTAEQKMEVIRLMLDSLKHWRDLGNRSERAFPESFQEALRVLFPNGL